MTDKTNEEDSSHMEMKWDWVPCNYQMNTTINGKERNWNLQPSIILTNPNENVQDPIIKLFIDTERSLKYSKELGWNWHKSWNLPNISLRLEIKDSVKENLLTPKNLFANIFATKAISIDPEEFHLIDVGLSGTTKLELLNGQAFFSTIKFKSTSYNHEGSKFHLVICLYIQNEDDEFPRVLNSTISPPIYVDSRNNDNNKIESNDKKIQQYIEPFPLENLDRAFVKRENKKRNENDILIDEDLSGLYNYFTAPNIRNKVKHPLFLAIKFNKCVNLYYNERYFTYIQEEINLRNLYLILQENILKDLNSGQNTCQQPKDQQFVLQINRNIAKTIDDSQYKKATEQIDCLSCNSLQILHENNSPEVDIDTNIFKNFNSLGENLAEVYRTVYQQLQIIYKDNNESEYEDKSQDNSYQDIKKQTSAPQLEKKKQHSIRPGKEETLNKPGKECEYKKQIEDLQHQIQENQGQKIQYQSSAKNQTPMQPQQIKQNSTEQNKLNQSQMMNQNINFPHGMKQGHGQIVAGIQGNNTVNNFQVQINQVKQQQQVDQFKQQQLNQMAGYPAYPPQMGQMQPNMYNQHMNQQQMMKQMSMQQPGFGAQFGQGPPNAQQMTQLNQQFLMQQMQQPHMNPQQWGQQMHPGMNMMNHGFQMPQMQQPMFMSQMPPQQQFQPGMPQMMQPMHHQQMMQMQNKNNVKSEER